MCNFLSYLHFLFCMKTTLFLFLFSVATVCIAVDLSGRTSFSDVVMLPDSTSSVKPSARNVKKKDKGKTADLTEQVSRSGRNAQALADTARGQVPQLAIDSLRSDTLAADSVASDSAKKDSGLEFPVQYEASDSTTYDADTRLSTLFGNSKVVYQDMQLEAAIISMNNDSSLAHAIGVKDSVNGWVGKPVYKQKSDNYESEEMTYNFKTKKGFIKHVSTAQGDGFLNSESSKRGSDGTLFLQHAKYTTCDHDPPHFYLALSRAKVYPGKEAIFGPAYLVVADVPLPLAVPMGFFPFTRSYSSGFIMPTYGSETSRGFYLRNGGYYFAINDRVDLNLLGEVYTKGSWGLNASSTYRKRYKYSGNVYVNYQNTVEGEKNMPDYTKSTSFKLQWSHRQDTKASMYSNLSASVNFATSNFERNDLAGRYDPVAYTQSTRTSSVSYSRTIPSLNMTLSASSNLSQNMQDSTIAMTLPDLNIAISRFYPFKRKKVAGKPHWYEKISMTYTGQLSNSINTKEDKLMKSSLVKDWRNGMLHTIPLSATFSLFKYINVSPTVNFRDRMYTNKIMQSWDVENQTVARDTIYGFYNVYNWDAALSASTTLYGFYKPWKKLFGDKIIAVRHVLKPTLSYNYSPDFGTATYGYYDTYVKTDANGNVSTVSYSPYSSGLYGVPGRGKTGSISMSLSNNLEMKIKSDADSTGEKKISLIDEFSANMSYNMAAVTRPWSDLSTRIRLKLTKRYTFSMAAMFATYAYKFNENGNVVVGDRTEWSYGRFGRFQGMSQNLSYTFNNSTFKKKDKTRKQSRSSQHDDDLEDLDLDEDEDVNESNVDPELRNNNVTQERERSKINSDGYMNFSIPWSFTVSYGISMRENTSAKINEKTMRYPYKFTQNLNFSGHISLSEGWNISYNSGYDFNFHRLSMTTASLSRDLHCFSMTCSVVLKPYTSFNFSFRAKMSTIADLLKWEKRSSYSTNVVWE